DAMPKYLIQASFTQQGLEGIKKGGGSARREQLSATAKSVGGSLEAFYFAFGEADVCLIMDVPSNVDAAALALTSAASGAVKTKTTVLLTPEEMDEAAKRSVEYRPPGK